MMSLEEAMHSPTAAAEAEKLIAEIDKEYSELIVWKDKCVAALMTTHERQRGGFDGNSLGPIESEPYIPARRRIEDILNGRLEQDGGIGRWEEGLVSVTRNKEHGRITDYQKLSAEAARCKAWLAHVDQ
jgi:hypothetical protein